MNKWTVEVQEDPETGDLILPFSPEMLAQVGWDFGDTIVWEDHGNGSWSLTKQGKENETTRVRPESD